MSSWHSYPKIYNLGHKRIKDIYNGSYFVQEKVDGSQFSFGVHNGKLVFRSRSREYAVDGMFSLACEQVKSVEHRLVEGWTYRGEYLRKPKHNALAYDRVPRGNIALFDIEVGESDFMVPMQVAQQANILNFDVVPTYCMENKPLTPELLKAFLEKDSFLGGVKIEGVVIKNYNQFTPEGHVMMGKYVSEAFKEKHGKQWKKDNPNSEDIIQSIAKQYCHENRWLKAGQHLEEQGQLKYEPEDIGRLIKEVNRDVLEECKEDIKNQLFAWAWKKGISKGITRGLPEWYKEKLFNDSVA